MLLSGLEPPANSVILGAFSTGIMFLVRAAGWSPRVVIWSPGQRVILPITTPPLGAC